MRLLLLAVAAAGAALSAAAAFAGDARVQTRGKIDVAANTPMVAVSTDEVVQRVLNDDFYAARRSPAAITKAPATLTVTVSERVLKPGVSLNDLAPGDPGVVSLLRAAGATPPPVGDSGAAQIDPYENDARRQATRPDDAGTEYFRQQQAFDQSMRNGGSPGAETPDNQVYDTVIVARVTVGDRRDMYTVVAVAHPGDDLRQTKRLMAEDIANAALH
jgi:hypothetical protein